MDNIVNSLFDIINQILTNASSYWLNVKTW